MEFFWTTLGLPPPLSGSPDLVPHQPRRIITISLPPCRAGVRPKGTHRQERVLYPLPQDEVPWTGSGSRGEIEKEEGQ